MTNDPLEIPTHLKRDHPDHEKAVARGRRAQAERQESEETPTEETPK
jgi:hypothetical protein|tara:strand:+ start:1059 stop:1199 length:141 start_codon:yes stop_codon:yes gene_type:complete